MANILLIVWLLLVSARGQEQGQGQQCKEQEFAQIRSNYESCASKKIREITSWLQTEEEEGEVKEEGVMAVCVSVRQLIHDCGNALSYCFKKEQVSCTMCGILLEILQGQGVDPGSTTERWP